MGMLLHPHPDGLALEQVLPGTPAHACGLMAGDIIAEMVEQVVASDNVAARAPAVHRFQGIATLPQEGVAAHIRVFGATRALRLVLRLIKRDATAPPADKQRCATDAIDHEVEI